jgi:hypothetical protein
MAKRKKLHDAFELAIRQMSIPQLKKLGQIYKKSLSHCDTRADYVNRLNISMKPAERVQAMRDFILAGQTSMTIYAMELPKDTTTVTFEYDFTGTASKEPTIVTVGELDEIIKGQQHVQWALATGSQTYLDLELNLKIEPEGMVVDSFFESKTTYLQVRTNASNARRIAEHWAKQMHVSYDTNIRRIALTTEAEVHEFAKQLSGRIRKCSGNKKESKGMLRMSGTRHPNIDDLQGTEDYTAFLATIDPADFQIEFDHDQKSHVLSIGLESGSLYFMTLTPEKTMQYVYRELKAYLKDKV